MQKPTGNSSAPSERLSGVHRDRHRERGREREDGPGHERADERVPGGHEDLGLAGVDHFRRELGGGDVWHEKGPYTSFGSRPAPSTGRVRARPHHPGATGSQHRRSSHGRRPARPGNGQNGTGRLGDVWGWSQSNRCAGVRDRPPVAAPGREYPVDHVFLWMGRARGYGKSGRFGPRPGRSLPRLTALAARTAGSRTGTTPIGRAGFATSNCPAGAPPAPHQAHRPPGESSRARLADKDRRADRTGPRMASLRVDWAGNPTLHGGSHGRVPSGRRGRAGGRGDRGLRAGR